MKLINKMKSQLKEKTNKANKKKSKNNNKKNQPWCSDFKSSVFKIKTIKSENNSYLTILFIFSLSLN